MTNLESIIYIGIDVSKAKLDVYIPSSGKHFVVKNNVTGLNELLEKTQDLNAHFLMEATGGYERLAKKFIAEQNKLVTILNAKRVKDFARSKGCLAKTDKIDARLISEFGSVMKPMPTHFNEQHERLFELNTRLEQLKKMLNQEKNRIEKSSDESVKNSINTSIELFTQQTQAIIDEIDTIINADESLKRKSEIMQSVKGVGEKTSIALLAMLSELGELSSKEIAALAGLAPYNVDSGLKRGKRRIYGGRRDVRNALHMATMVAIQYNPKIRSYYERLHRKGKEKMVCIAACARKLLCIINAMLRNDMVWDASR